MRKGSTPVRAPDEPRNGFIALLRGINVGRGNRLAMADLRSLCADLGWARVNTYIQSGNVVFTAAAAPAQLESAMEAAIAERFSIRIPVIVRAAEAWPHYVAGNPFPDASEREPNLVMLALSKAAPHPDALAVLAERATNGERIAQVGDGLWIHFRAGVTKSKLSPGLFDRTVGSPVTTRNWRTVLKLNALSREASAT